MKPLPRQAAGTLAVMQKGHPAKEVIIQIEKDAYMSCEIEKGGGGGIFAPNKGILVIVGFAEHFIK